MFVLFNIKKKPDKQFVGNSEKKMTSSHLNKEDEAFQMPIYDK